MNEKSYLADAIILDTTPFKEDDLIVHAFTKQLGLSSFFLKRGRKKEALSFSPFTIGEMAYDPKEKDLLKGIEFSPQNFNLGLRSSLENLETAFALKNLLKEFIYPYKPLPALFLLFTAFIKNIPLSKNPQNLTLAFMIKLLKHEGLLNYPLYCAHCGEETPLFSFNLEGFFCKNSKKEGVQWEEKEVETLWSLFVAREFQEIDSLTIPPLFKEKLTHLYSMLKSL